MELKDLTISELAEKRRKDYAIISDVLAYDYEQIDRRLQHKTLHINLNNPVNVEYIKRLELRKEISELNKEINDILVEYIKKTPYENITFTQRMSLYRSEIILKFAYANWDANPTEFIKTFFYDSTSKFYQKFFDCLSEKTMKNLKTFLKMYIDWFKSNDRYQRKEPNEALWGIFHQRQYENVKYAPMLPDNSSKIYDAFCEYNEINKLMPDDKELDLDKNTHLEGDQVLFNF